MPQPVTDRLAPDRVRGSPMFHAVLACPPGRTGRTRPNRAAVAVTSDGFLLGAVEGDVGFNHSLRTTADLAGLADTVGLTTLRRRGP